MEWVLMQFKLRKLRKLEKKIKKLIILVELKKKVQA